MSLPTSAYGALAKDSYEDRVADPSKEHWIEGRAYTVLATDSHWTGYQGTVYQDVDTSEIIVAHRGSERGSQLVQDWGLANANMVFNRINPQIGPASALTERALEIAREQERDYGQPIRVSTTGHSLGGALAQVSAHQYGLHGETFNAYGAVNLNLGIPQGGAQVINHVRATDIVSAGSQHFGEVRAYAIRKDVQDLLADGQDPRTQGIGGFVSDIARVGFDPHDIQQFYRHNPISGAPLISAENARRYQHNREMFDTFRHDIYQTRAMLSNSADLSRTLMDNVRTHGTDLPGRVLRGDSTVLPQELDAGAPDMVRREAVNRLNRVREFGGDLQRHTGQFIDGVRQGGERAIDGVREQGRRLIDKVQDRGEHLMDGARDRGERLLDGLQDRGEQLQRELQDAGAQWNRLFIRQGMSLPGQVTATAQITNAVATMADPTHPGHPLYRQAYDGLRQLDPQMLGLRTDQELQNAAGTLACEAKANGLQRIDHVLVNRDGSGLFAVEGAIHDPAHFRVYVDKAQAAAQPLEQSAQQLHQETQRQAQEREMPSPQHEPPRGRTH